MTDIAPEHTIDLNVLLAHIRINLKGNCDGNSEKIQRT